MSATSNGISSTDKKAVSINGLENFTEISIPVPWGHISGKWWGSTDKQPVIAIHGWQDNAGTFDTLAPLLAKDMSILCIDLPGHGFSSHFPMGQYYYIFWDGIIIIRRIVKHFKWNKVKLMGHSLGGAISFLYAATYPSEVDCYISIDIASPTVRDAAQLVTQMGDSLDRFLKYETMPDDSQPSYDREEMLSLVYDAYRGDLTRESCELLMKRGMKTSTSKDDAYLFSRDVRLKVPTMGFFTLDQVMEFASRITCAVMNIKGDPGMKWVNPENYDIVLNKIKETASHFEKHIVKGSHHLHLNDGKVIEDIVKKFLLRK